MNRPRRGRGRRAALSVLVAALLAGVVGWACLKRLTVGEPDRRPPAKVFRDATGRAPAAGEYAVRAVGRRFKHFVWARVEAKTDAGLNSLLASLTPDGPLPPDAAREAMRQTVSANDRYDEQDRAAAGWDAALALPAPDVYRFWHGQPGDPLLWSGILVVDRADRRLYLHALGD